LVMPREKNRGEIKLVAWDLFSHESFSGYPTHEEMLAGTADETELEAKRGLKLSRYYRGRTFEYRVGPGDLLSPPEVAAILGIHRVRAYALIREGKIRSVKRRGKLFVPFTEVRKAYDQRGKEVFGLTFEVAEAGPSATAQRQPGEGLAKTKEIDPTKLEDLTDEAPRKKKRGRT
jgi:excisionase family DNA binding protein